MASLPPRACAKCGAVFSREHFSKSAWKKGQGKSRCFTCNGQDSLEVQQAKAAAALAQLEANKAAALAEPAPRLYQPVEYCVHNDHAHDSPLAKHSVPAHQAAPLPMAHRMAFLMGAHNTRAPRLCAGCCTALRHLSIDVLSRIFDHASNSTADLAGRWKIYAAHQALSGDCDPEPDGLQSWITCTAATTEFDGSLHLTGLDPPKTVQKPLNSFELEYGERSGFMHGDCDCSNDCDCVHTHLLDGVLSFPTEFLAKDYSWPHMRASEFSPWSCSVKLYHCKPNSPVPQINPNEMAPNGNIEIVSNHGGWTHNTSVSFTGLIADLLDELVEAGRVTTEQLQQGCGLYRRTPNKVSRQQLDPSRTLRDYGIGKIGQTEQLCCLPVPREKGRRYVQNGMVVLDVAIAEKMDISDPEPTGEHYLCGACIKRYQGADFSLPCLKRELPIYHDTNGSEDKLADETFIDASEPPLQVLNGDLTICVGWRERGGHGDEASYITYLCRRAE